MVVVRENTGATEYHDVSLRIDGLAILGAVLWGCSSTSSGGGVTADGGSHSPQDGAPVDALTSDTAIADGPVSDDAAVGYACGVANQAPVTSCPTAPGGTCYNGVCDPKSLPDGVACSGQKPCEALIDPCPNLQANSDVDYYACDCVGGHWVCGLCAPGAAECLDAGPDGSVSDSALE